MSDFSRGQIKSVVATYLMAASHFDESQPQLDILNQLFCFAVRDVLAEERQATGRSRAEILHDLAARTRAQVLPETYLAFTSLPEEEFSRLFDAVNTVAWESGLAWPEFVEGLSSVNEIVDDFLNRQAENSSPPSP